VIRLLCTIDIYRRPDLARPIFKTRAPPGGL
jgi:hypothetical protein